MKHRDGMQEVTVALVRMKIGDGYRNGRVDGWIRRLRWSTHPVGNYAHSCPLEAKFRLILGKKVRRICDDEIGLSKRPTVESAEDRGLEFREPVHTGNAFAAWLKPSG